MSGRPQLCFAPTVSAITAPRAPNGFSAPMVESRAVAFEAKAPQATSEVHDGAQAPSSDHIIVGAARRGLYSGVASLL